MNYESFYKLSYGLFIISTAANNKKNGYIANTVFQVTSEPAQLAISCSKDNYTAGMIQKSRRFSVSVLQKDTNAGLIALFGYKSGRDINKFESVNHMEGTYGIPIVLEDTVAWFECEMESEADLGTHILFIGKVINAKLMHPDRDPLTYKYYREVRNGLAPPNAPTYIDKAKLEHNEAVKQDKKRYQCQVCDYIYDPEIGDEGNGIIPDTSFENLPEDWVCPVCGATKDMFETID